MASLATSLTAIEAEFNNELTYVHGMATRLANRPAYEKEGMQVLSREDTKTLNLCKSMMRKGECPPLMVVFDHVEGVGKMMMKSRIPILLEWNDEFQFYWNHRS
ncbi:unnamed protein product [Lactuca saligna]|uniref:Uncharacterized protein n=1 Tax=Lactuca saligna TaxID=75948 RepID=A0AA35ZQS4_LACSI|nr:unnamed protein product [Lactuca saligna]